MNQKLLLAIMCISTIFVGSVIGQPAGNWTADETIGTADPGYSTLDNGVYSVTGNGNDIWDNADAFQYLYRELSGDGSMTARVIDDGDGSNTWAKGGVMIRETTDPGSAHAMMVMTDTDGGGGSFQYRSTTDGGSTNSDVGTGITEPYWVRIERVGDDFSGYISEDGETWTQQGTTQTISMAEDVLIGLCVTSHAAGELRTFQFDNLSVTGGVTPFTSPALASVPIPTNGKTDILRDASVAWSPGIYPGTHDVYLGKDFNDVNDASRTSPMGVKVAQDLDVNSVDVGRLDFGETYYWRVDEANSSADQTIHKGLIWSFEVEPYAYPVASDLIVASASSVAPKFDVNALVDGNGLSDGQHGVAENSQWLSTATDFTPTVRFDFVKPQILNKVIIWNSNQSAEGFVGWGAKDIVMETSVDGETWTVVEGATQLTRAPGDAKYNTPDEIALGDVLVQHVRIQILSSFGGLPVGTGLSEVQFHAVPMYARMFTPADGSTDLDPRATASWRSGRQADQHEVYVSEDPNMTDATTQMKTSNTNSYDLAQFDLTLGKSYYWRVDEVNEVETPSTWTGPILSMGIQDALIVDNFESYSNISPDRPFQTWLDGKGYSVDEYFPVKYDGNGSGAAIGHDIWTVSSPYYQGSIMEETLTLPDSTLSMPYYYYDNGSGSSHVDRTWTTPQDWSAHGIKTLVIHFMGDAENTGGSLYVKINGKKVTYPNDADLKLPMWFQWNIDLGTLGTNLSNVTSMSVGIDNIASGGVLYLDDFLLYLDAPAVVEPTPLSNEGLIASYSMESNVKDGSGNGNNGTLVGNATYAQGLFGMALQLDGLDSCVDLGEKEAFNPTGSFSVSVWANIQDWTTDWGCVMVSNRGEGTVGWQLRRYASTDSFCFTTRGVGVDDLQSQRAAPLEEWVQVVGVYDQENGTKRIYINGSLDVEASTSTDPNQTVIGATTHNTYIGARATSANDGQETFFTGMLDDVMLYDRALSEGEVRYMNGAR